MPVGHPERIQMNYSINWSKPDDIPEPGIWKVFVIPPDKLYIPVLPFKVEKRLIFPLCRSCTLENIGNRINYDVKCDHNDEQRGFVATTTSIELALALEKGYRAVHAYEGYIWKKWSTDIFKDFIAKNLRVKIQASGKPSNMVNEEEFLTEIEKIYDFKLDTSKWIKNEGLRTIAKLRLNSSWGKLAQRSDLSQIQVCRQPEDIAKLFRTPGVKVLSIEPVREDTMYVRYKHKEQFVKENDFSNVVLALWTTSSARIRLYRFMEKCVENGGTLGYCDTGMIQILKKKTTAFRFHNYAIRYR
jgi:hypothetical protein